MVFEYFYFLMPMEKDVKSYCKCAVHIYIDSIATLIRLDLFVLQKQKLTNSGTILKTILPCFLFSVTLLPPLLSPPPPLFFIDCQRSESQRFLLGMCLHIDGCVRKGKSTCESTWILSGLMNLTLLLLLMFLYLK
jgi:hypothetical protein